MKLKALAEEIGTTVPVIMGVRQKSVLLCSDYSDGHLVVSRKLLYLSLLSVPNKDLKALVGAERRLLELLKVDSLHGSPDWFERMSVMKSGPTRLVLTGHDIGHPVLGDAVQEGLDFSERKKELFGDREMGSDALVGLRKYAEILERIRARLKREIPVHREALKWCRNLF